MVVSSCVENKKGKDDDFSITQQCLISQAIPQVSGSQRKHRQDFSSNR